MRIALALLLSIVAANVLALPASAQTDDHIRLGIPSAFGLRTGSFDFTIGQRSYDESSSLSARRIAATLFRADYQFTDTVGGYFAFNNNGTNGGRAVINPFWNNTTSANAWEGGFKIVLSKTEPPADPKAAYLPNGFAVGANYSSAALNGTVDNTESLVNAYLVYTGALSDKLMAHTYFSSGRFSGDIHGGSLNTIGVGVDYDVLQHRDNKLQIQANAKLNVYNFRSPAFNSTRVTDYDVSLNYFMGHDVKAVLGYGFVDDSDSNANSNEFFWGLQFGTGGIHKHKKAEEQKPGETKPADGQPAAPPAQTPPAGGK